MTQVRGSLSNLTGQIMMKGYDGSSMELINELKASTRVFSKVTTSASGKDIKLHTHGQMRKPGSLKVKNMVLRDLGASKVLEVTYKKRNRPLWNLFILFLVVFTFVIGAVIVWLIFRDKPQTLESMARISFDAMELEVEGALT